MSQYHVFVQIVENTCIGILTDLPADMDVKAVVTLVDEKLDDYEAQDYNLDRQLALLDEGALRDIKYTPHWILVDEETLLCHNRYTISGIYCFIQLHKFEDGRYGVAEAYFDLKNHDRAELEAMARQIGLDPACTQLHLNWKLARHFFETKFDSFIIPNLKFDSELEAKKHISSKVDCFMGAGLAEKQVVYRPSLLQLLQNMTDEQIKLLCIRYDRYLVLRNVSEPLITLADFILLDIHSGAAKPNEEGRLKNSRVFWTTKEILIYALLLFNAKLEVKEAFGTAQKESLYRFLTNFMAGSYDEVVQ